MGAGLIYIGIALILIISLVGALIVFFRSINQQRKLHETILRSQNEKEIETYSRIAGEYLHQQVINGRILPHLIRLKELNQLVTAAKSPRNQIISDKIQELMNDLKQTENIVRNISENIFPPHLTYFFVETCQKRLSELQELYPLNKTEIVFQSEGSFSDLAQFPTLLYNLYSLIDLFTTNSIRHAQASRIFVVLKREPKQITLDMRDKGIGFDMKEVEKNTKGRGLADFRGRAIILSPQYIFESEAEKGTYFRISVPINTINHER